MGRSMEIVQMILANSLICQRADSTGMEARIMV